MNNILKRIMCITLAMFALFCSFAICVQAADDSNKINSVRFSGDGSTLTVKATLSDGMVEANKGRPIFLFAFPPCAKNADIKNATPLAFTMATGELTYEIDMAEADPQLKYSKFILATGKETEYNMFGNVVYAENPEALAKAGLSPMQTDSPVGICVDVDPVSERFRHTVLPISINELLADTADGSVRYEYGDKVYYFDSEVLARLDSDVRELSQNGAKIYLRILLSKPNESTATLAEKLYTSKGEGRYYAINTNTAEGTRIFGAIMEFLCARYSADDHYGTVDAYVLGENVNINENYVGGPDDVDSFGADLLRTLRVMDTAIRSTCRGTALYLSLGAPFSGPQKGAQPAQELLRTVCGGDVPFGIYMDTTPQTPYFWLEDEITPEYGTPRITPKNIDFFMEFLGAEKMLYNGERRPVILGYGVDTDNADHQAASILCALYKVMGTEGVTALIYSNYRDTEGTHNGLADADGMPKPVYGTLCTAAEGDSETIAEQIRALLSKEEYSALRDTVLSDLFVVRDPLPVYNGDLPAEVKASYLADFVDSSLYGFEVNAQTLTHGFTMDTSGTVLRLTARSNTAGMSRAFENYDLSGKSILAIELKAQTAAPGAKFTIILEGTRNGEGVSLSATEALTPGQWDELAFDVSSIDTLTGISMSVTADGKEQLSWFIKDITAYSSSLKADALALRIAVSILVAVLIIFILLLITLIYLRSRKRPVAKDKYKVSRRPAEKGKAVEKPHPAPPAPVPAPKQEGVKAERTVPIMPKTETKTFVVPPKQTEPVKRSTMSLGIEPISGNETMEIDKTKGE